MRHKNTRSGFMILELLGAIAVLAIVVLAIGAYKVAAAGHLKAAFLRYQAVNLATSQINDLKQIARNDFNDPKLSEGAHPEADSNLDVPEDAELTYTVVDRYDWDEDGTDPLIPPPAGDDDIDYKVVTVTCEYMDGKEIGLQDYIAKR